MPCTDRSHLIRNTANVSAAVLRSLYHASVAVLSVMPAGPYSHYSCLVRVYASPLTSGLYTKDQHQDRRSRSRLHDVCVQSSSGACPLTIFGLAASRMMRCADYSRACNTRASGAPHCLPQAVSLVMTVTSIWIIVCPYWLLLCPSLQCIYLFLPKINCKL